MTEKQKTLYLLIQSYREQHGFPPSQREMAATIGISRSTVRDHLRALEKKGYISRNSRGIIDK